MPPNYFEPITQGLLVPASRYTAVDGSGLYTNELNQQVKAANADATRDELDVLGTDFVSLFAMPQGSRYRAETLCRYGAVRTSRRRSI